MVPVIWYACVGHRNPFLLDAHLLLGVMIGSIQKDSTHIRWLRDTACIQELGLVLSWLLWHVLSTHIGWGAYWRYGPKMSCLLGSSHSTCPTAGSLRRHLVTQFELRFKDHAINIGLLSMGARDAGDRVFSGAEMDWLWLLLFAVQSWGISSSTSATLDLHLHRLGS